MIIIYTLCGSKDEARKIGRALIELDAAAYVNILPTVTSIGRWEGKVDEATEVPLIIKTRAHALAKTVKIIETMHSYETPSILSWNADILRADYNEWMRQNLKDFT